MKRRSAVGTWILIIAAALVAAGCQSSPDAGLDLDQASSCGEHEYGAGMERIGLLESGDGGATWKFRGQACFHAPELLPVDPSPLLLNGELTLYFLDLLTLNRSTVSPTIYRASSGDGLEFSPPQPVIILTENLTDPFIIRLPKGAYKMYLGQTTNPGGILSATSADGLDFGQDSFDSPVPGGTPGALALPDSQIRLFAAGPEGITSYISPNGQNFDPEPGARIPTNGIRVTDPHPIRLASGGYAMVFTVHPPGEFASERNRLASLEIHLAFSEDGFDWTVDPEPIGRGGVPGIVEEADGRLLVYYVDVNY